MIIEGKVIRKKKRPTGWVLSVKPADQVSIPVHVALDHTYEFLFLHAVIRITAYQLIVEGQQQDDTLYYANDIELLQCSHIPTVIPLVLQGIVEGRYDPSVLLLPTVDDSSSSTSTSMTVEKAKGLIDLPAGRQKRVAIAEISRILEGRGAYKPPRSRLPFVKRKEWDVLEKLQRATGARGWTLQNIVTREYDDGEEEKDRDDNTRTNKESSAGDVWEKAPLNIPEAPTTLPDRGARPTREEYILNKKLPQVRWMVRRVLDLYSNSHAPRHILDVGGGRGDLATALALALPTTRLTVVDVNPPSLEAGKAYAQARGCADQIDFVCADMVDFVNQKQQQLDESSSPVTFDLVVALHACGDLSDLAVQFAIQRNASFVICPCCYAKRKIAQFEPPWERLCDSETQATLRRLSELNLKPEVSRLSMQLINSMRYQCIKENQYCVSLAQYDIAKSTRNHVFVGIK